MIAWVSSNSTGCRYCQAHAIRAAEHNGAEQEKLDNIWEYRTHSAFSEAERAALYFSLVASQVPNGVDETIKKRLYEYWDEGEIVETLGVISLFGYLNRWNDSMGILIEGGAVESGEKYLGKNGWEKGSTLKYFIQVFCILSISLFLFIDKTTNGIINKNKSVLL